MHFLLLGKYLNKVDRVMTQVDKITEDIANMPVAAFIFKESDDIDFSISIDRYNSSNKTKIIIISKNLLNKHCKVLKRCSEERFKKIQYDFKLSLNNL